MNYKVYQGTELKQTVTSKTAVMNGLQPNKTYEFGVQPDNVQTGAVGANLIVQSELKPSYLNRDDGGVAGGSDFHSDNYIPTNGATVFTFSSPDYVFKGSGNHTLAMYDTDKNYLGYQLITSATQTLTKPNAAYIRFSINFTDEGSTSGNLSDWLSNHRYKLEKGSVATTYVTTISVTTRGIRFNIPKTLTVGSTITLRYEEYPLGIVPIGNEPSGYFGGGNKQNLSAKVISTANGSSVVEVAGNVIEVGGRNLVHDTSFRQGLWKTAWNNPSFEVTNEGNIKFSISNTDQHGIGTPLEPVEMLKPYTLTLKMRGHAPFEPYIMYNGIPNLSIYAELGAAYPMIDSATEFVDIKYTFTPVNRDISKQGVFAVLTSGAVGNWLEIKKDSLKLEPGTIATPYASFVDGDTFIAQPDGTCALFSEYKALYY